MPFLSTGLILDADPHALGLANNAPVTEWSNQIAGQNEGVQGNSANQGFAVTNQTPANKTAIRLVDNDWYDFGNILSGLTKGTFYFLAKMDAGIDQYLYSTTYSEADTNYDLMPLAANGNLYCGWGATDRKASNVAPGVNLTTEYRLFTIVSDANDWRLYVDGTLVHSSSSNTVTFPAVFEIGRSKYASGTGNRFYARANFLRALVYNIAHTPTEVGQNKTEFANFFQLTSLGYVPDTTVPSDVTNLTATKFSNARVDIDSDAATDNVAVAGYQTQRRIDGGSWVTLTPTSKAFSDTENFPTTAGTYSFEYRRKAFDTASPPNYSTNWSNIVSATITIPAPPVITSPATLPYARIGYSYTYQLTKSGGSGAGNWSASVQGNLPSGQPNTIGLIAIPTVGGSNYTFTSRFDDTNGTFDTQAHTIPVTNLALWEWCYKRPLPIEHLWAHRIYEPLVGTDKAFRDIPDRFRFTLDVQYLSNTERDNIIAFIEAHSLRESFLFASENDPAVYHVCKIVEAPDRAEMFTYGGIRLIFETV